MRQIWITCLIAALSVLAVEGQSIKVGGEFGTNWSRFSNDPNNFKSDARTGYQAGLSLRLGSKVYFQPEFQWVWTKSELTEPFDIGVPFSQEYDVHSFRVPVQIGYKLVGNDKVNMRLFTGPVFNFNFDTENPQSQIPVQDLKPFNTAIRFGGGFDLWLFNIDVSYDLGVTNAFENSNSKFRGINTELGIHIPIK